MSNKQETRHTITEGNMLNRIVLVLFSAIEVALGFRFFFKLIGANPDNVFVKGLYAITQFIVGIFEGIFSIATTTGAETEAVFEPATLIAIIVVAIIAWGIMKLMSNSSTNQIKKTEVTSENTDQPQ
jgi:glucan phosphoethanolaminetransferase (alkaline phosphatase superfamily)